MNYDPFSGDLKSRIQSNFFMVIPNKLLGMLNKEIWKVLPTLRGKKVIDISPVFEQSSTHHVTYFLKCS